MIKNFKHYNLSYCEAVSFLKADYSNEIHITMNNDTYHVFWVSECQSYHLEVFKNGDWVASFKDCLDALFYVNGQNNIPFK